MPLESACAASRAMARALPQLCLEFTRVDAVSLHHGFNGGSARISSKRGSRQCALMSREDRGAREAIVLGVSLASRRVFGEAHTWHNAPS